MEHLAGISIANKEFGIKLVNIVVSKIDVEEDIETCLLSHTNLYNFNIIDSYGLIATFSFT
jgi:hypothetical protein